MRENSRSSRELRKLVAAVGELPPDEIAGILGELDERERNRVAPLLAELLEIEAPVERREALSRTIVLPRADWKRRLQGAPDWLVGVLVGSSADSSDPATFEVLGRRRLRRATRLSQGVRVTAATHEALIRIFAEPRMGRFIETNDQGLTHVIASRIRNFWSKKDG